MTQRAFITGFIISMVVLIGASILILMSGCAAIDQSVLSDEPVCKVQDVYVGFYDKCFVHVAGKDNSTVTFEVNGPGFTEKAEKEKDLDRITVEPIIEEGN